MGMDKDQAFAAARKLNAVLLVSNDLVAKVAAGAKTVAEAINVLRADDLPHRGWAPKTAAWYEVFLKRIEADLGKRPVHEVSVRDCAEYIRQVTESARSRQTYRLVLGWIFACALQEGWISENPALQTLKHRAKRKRERLTVEIYRAIHASAPLWLQNAMDLSLLSLQRREDIVSAQFAHVREGVWRVVPQKTENSSQARLEIVLTPDLQAVTDRCRDQVVSPYLVHRLPEKQKPRGHQAAARSHPTQVLPEQLTREFASIRDRLELGGDHPPTFHEIRSLGAALLMSEAGWTKQQVQELLAHQELSTTEIYLEDHDLPWTRVTPGLKLP
jgi:integrase